MAKTKKPRWCKCGHESKKHYNARRDVGMQVAYERFRCHATFCACRLFTLDSSLWSRIKRKLNAR